MWGEAPRLGKITNHRIDRFGQRGGVRVTSERPYREASVDESADHVPADLPGPSTDEYR
jgi:hypothetical protein